MVTQGEHHLPPLPPARCRPEAGEPRAQGGRGQQLPDPALGGLWEDEQHRLAGAPPVEPARRQGPEGLRLGRRHHRPARPRQAAPGHHLPVRAQAGRRPEDRREHAAARGGPDLGHADHHHHAPEVPLRRGEDRQAARTAATPSSSTRPTAPDRRSGSAHEGGAGGEEPGGRREKDGGRRRGRTSEDRLVKVMASRGKQKNLSFFAFTATPKAKTLEIFGHRTRRASRSRSTSTRCAKPSRRASSSTCSRTTRRTRRTTGW